MAPSKSYNYSSETECQIGLKLGCKFKFVRCLETYVKKFVSLDHEGNVECDLLVCVCVCVRVYVCFCKLVLSLNTSITGITSITTGE